MAIFPPQQKLIKTNHKILIRSAKTEDAEELLQLAKAMIAEEIYQLTTSEEFTMTIESETKWIENHLNNPNDLILIGIMDSKIVGLLDFSNGRRQRIAHTGAFGMSVATNVRDQGIGTLLLRALIEWAKTHPQIEKLGLNVHSNNERAIATYKKVGFEIEGIRKRDLKYAENQYVDTTVMGLWVK